MSNVRHRIFVGHPDRQADESTETFRLLTQAGDFIITEDSNNIIQQNG